MSSFSDGPEQRIFEALVSALGGLEAVISELRTAASECAHVVAQKSPVDAPSPSANDPASWRWFLVLGEDSMGSTSPSEHVVSSVSVEHVGSHDRVRVWSRGGHAGELVVSEGDGEAFAQRLGLLERLSSRDPIRIVSDLTSNGAARDQERKLIDSMRAPTTEDDVVEQLRSMTLRQAYEEGLMVGMRRARRSEQDAELLLGMVRICFESYRSKTSPDPAQLIAAVGSLLGEPT